MYFTEQSKKDVISFFSTDKNLKSKDFINLVLKDPIFKNEIRTKSPKRKETDSIDITKTPRRRRSYSYPTPPDASDMKKIIETRRGNLL